VLDPWPRYQNSYFGAVLLHVPGVPVMVTVVPDGCGDAGAADAVTEAQDGDVVTYVVLP
jgi:hypothetical protein